jgi:hypothetical protein
MKPPPLLLGTALTFWGWQSGLLIPGLLMGVIVESARFVHARWEFSDADFSRVWTFCALLFLGAGVFAFTSSNGPENFGSWLQNPGIRTQGAAGLSAARTGAAIFRWMPMIFFPFLAAQLFSTREVIPLATVSLVVRRRQRRARKEGRPIPPSRDVNISWAFFVGTVLAASVHRSDDTSFFWGLAALLAWALWSQRSRRFALVIWLTTLALAIGLGFIGQRGYGVLQRYIEGMNAEWLARFMRRNVNAEQTTTALGQVGHIKTSGRIVIRVQPKNGSPVPTYLREASYRYYKGTTWTAGSSRNDTQLAYEEGQNTGNWTLLPGRTNTQAVNISCYLEGVKGNSPAGLLPLPAGVGRMEKLPAYVLTYNTAGAVLAEGPGLLIFDAIYGSGGTIDSVPGTGSTNVNRSEPVPIGSEASKQFPELLTRTNQVVSTNEDLLVYEREIPALDQIITELNLRGLPRDEALHKVSGFFADRFTYRLWQPPTKLGTNETALSRFLLTTRAGHCEYFATATTLLLRRLNIPTRYAVGYAVHETSGSGYVVRLRDAHAWCLVWNPKTQYWDNLDTTPASWVEQENKNASAFQWLQDAWVRLGFEFAKLRWGQSHLRLYLLIGIIPGLAVLFWQIIFRRRNRQKKLSSGKQAEIFDWPGLDSEFYQLEKKLADRGVVRGSSEPLNEWLARIATTPGLTELCAPMQEILRLHYRYRFDPLGLSPGDREILGKEVKSCLEALREKEQVVAR